jgi:hypothetical protein
MLLVAREGGRNSAFSYPTNSECPLRVTSWENRDLRQLLWHRHRMVQARTRIMNQLRWPQRFGGTWKG